MILPLLIAALIVVLAGVGIWLRIQTIRKHGLTWEIFRPRSEKSNPVILVIAVAVLFLMALMVYVAHPA